MTMNRAVLVATIAIITLSAQAQKANLEFELNGSDLSDAAQKPFRKVYWGVDIEK